MGKAAVAKAFEDIDAALAVLNAEADGCGSEPFSVADPLGGLGDGCLDILAGVRRGEAGFAGVKARAAVTFARTAEAVSSPDAPVQAQEMAVTAEVGCVLAIGPRAAGALLNQSHVLTTALPLTLAALQAGTISWQHARVMVEEAATLDRAGAAALEAHFLDQDAPDAARGCPAGEMPASRFRHKARTWRERHHAESIENRHAKGVLDRRVEYAPDRDGMAWLTAYLPGDEAVAIWNRTTAIARGLQGPEEPRTLTQLRADVLAAALLSSGTGGTSGTSGPGAEDGDNMNPAQHPGQVPPPRAQVLVTVPVFSLLGATDEPAMLDGYGPIPASMARDLVATGADSFYRVLVDPRDGAPLEIGRTSYRLTKAMRQWLRLRDGKCSFPGCSNNSLDNEADHLLAWHKGGTTGISNLGQACPAHHKLRHASPWTPTPATKNEPPGWISPSGRRYKSEHQDWEPPHWPHQLNPQEESKEGSPRGHPVGHRVSHPDFVHTGVSLGEDGLERFLHALA
ncbi:HNH endonuclease signature motif containing protein [Pseudarthrobacter sulfonivorans]|uniref:HNH endonuclease signature motif containing protein n=1 Tax=Pseudarthrobacter sulfonivorans TaxID=121292 RepID=UPI00168BCCE0|nr:HNH endonuclease signature motif containing protein [Pseudarthrobacter sulfonivorans]